VSASAGGSLTPEPIGGRRRASRTNAEWTAATVATLTRHARVEFGSRGYAQALVERICSEAGLTKGALYYHFGSKRGLFEAVIRDVERDIVERIEARADALDDPLDAVLAGSAAFLDVAIDDEFGVGFLIEGLHGCEAAGLLGDADLEMLATCSPAHSTRQSSWWPSPRTASSNMAEPRAR
jgi:AcrR family transcriptional regulator